MKSTGPWTEPCELNSAEQYVKEEELFYAFTWKDQGDVLCCIVLGKGVEYYDEHVCLCACLSP